MVPDAFRIALASLSPREREVLGLAARGLESTEIAERLSLSLRTVEAHRSHVAKKFGVNAIAEVFRRAALSGQDFPL